MCTHLFKAIKKTETSTVKYISNARLVQGEVARNPHFSAGF